MRISSAAAAAVTATANYFNQPRLALLTRRRGVAAFAAPRLAGAPLAPLPTARDAQLYAPPSAAEAQETCCQSLIHLLQQNQRLGLPLLLLLLLLLLRLLLLGLGLRCN